MADEKNMFVDMEHEVMDFWEKEKCFEKLREKIVVTKCSDSLTVL